MLSTPHLMGLTEATSGGHLSRSMMYVEMRALVQAASAGPATKAGFAKSIVDDNLLDKPTLASRKKSLRHLTELYGLDPTRALFRVFWQLAHTDLDALPQLCVICAYARDPLLRQSFEWIRPLRLGERVDRATMEHRFEAQFPGRFSRAMRSSLAQNVNTTWTFAGHLAGRVKKTRTLPEPRPASAAYAMFAGYIVGLRGERLLDSPYAALVASNRSHLQAALSLASARGLLSLKQAAGIVEFDFSNLLTPTEQAWIHESD